MYEKLHSELERTSSSSESPICFDAQFRICDLCKFWGNAVLEKRDKNGEQTFVVCNSQQRMACKMQSDIVCQKHQFFPIVLVLTQLH